MGRVLINFYDSDIPTYDYIRVILPSLKKTASLFKQVHPDVPVIMFPRGACTLDII